MDQKTEDKKPEASASSAPAANSLDQPSDANAAQSTGSMESPMGTGSKPDTVKKISPIKKFFKRFNIYLLGFIFVLVIAGAVTVVSYLNSKKAPEAPSITTQELSEDTIKQLANSDVTVGGSGQTLTVQGNAIFGGSVLMTSDLGVAGTLIANSAKIGTDLNTASLTVSTKASLADTQINRLQVATTTVMQGDLTLQNGLNVAGPSAFSGPVTIGQLTVNKLIMSGNASLQIPNHIAFPGATPGRSINPGVLGAGGSATISGSDTSGTVSINSGNNPTAGCYLSATFVQKFTSTPHVLISPVNAAAGNLNYYVTRDVNGFSVCSNNAAAGNQVFAFDYFVTN